MTTGTDELKALMQKMINKQDSLSLQLSNVVTQISLLNKTVAEQGDSLAYLHDEVQEIKDDMGVMKEEQNQLKHRMTISSSEQYMEEVHSLRLGVQNLERKARERNARIVGYKEEHGENCNKIVEYIIHNKLGCRAVVELAHRTGRRDTGRPRHILFRVSSAQDKWQILKNQRMALNGQGYYIIDDLTKADMDTKKRLQPVIQQARDKGQKWQFKNGQLIVNGQLYKEKAVNHSSQYHDTSRNRLHQPHQRFQQTAYSPETQQTHDAHQLQDVSDVSRTQQSPNAQRQQPKHHGSPLKHQPQGNSA